MALALYRKYRPRTFAEVIGQDHVTQPLSQALRSGRLNHAYLFSGPRGCGKTSSARILARSLNCEQGPTPEPCGVCASCKSLMNDGAGSIDVVEIDAASHGGVDDARDLREKAFFAPASSRFKIYVIDEAHMISSAGFNALLKLVEEPPDYVKFIFATTEPEKVLGTIRSRTHHYPFRLIPPAVLRPYLQQLTEAEGVHVEPAVLPLVVRAGGGSARDTLSVLDQLIAGAGPEGVSYARAVALLGVTDVALIDEMCDALAAGDGAEAYRTIDRVAEAGHDARRFASDLLERFRDLIVLQQVPDAVAKGLIDGPTDQLEAMTAQASRLGPATLSRCADIVHNGLIEMRGTTAPRLLLELITARMLLPGAEDSTGALLQRLERMERRLTLSADQDPTDVVRAQPSPSAPESASAPSPGGGISAARAAVAGAGRPAPERVVPPAAVTAPGRPAPERVAPAVAEVDAPVSAPPAEPVGVLPDAPEVPVGDAGPPGQLSAAAIREVWPEIMVTVGRKSKKIAALAQGATVRELEGQTVVLTFRFPAHAKMVAAEPALISDALYEALGGRWQIRCDVAGEAGPSQGSLGRAGNDPAGGGQARGGPAGNGQSGGGPVGGGQAGGSVGGVQVGGPPVGGGSVAGGQAGGPVGGGSVSGGSVGGGQAGRSVSGSSVSDDPVGSDPVGGGSVGGGPAGSDQVSGGSAGVGGVGDGSAGGVGSADGGPAGNGRGEAGGRRGDAATLAPSQGGANRGAAQRPPGQDSVGPVGRAQNAAPAQTRSGQGAASARREPAPQAPAADDGDDWPEPARPGGSAPVNATAVGEADLGGGADEDWPETASLGGAAPDVDGSRDLAEASGRPVAPADSRAGGSPSLSDDSHGVTGSVATAEGVASSGLGSARSSNTGTAIDGVGTSGLRGNGGQSGGPTSRVAPQSGPAGSAPPAGGSPALSGIAAARAALANASRPGASGGSTATAATAQPASNAWSDGSPAEEPPYDPEYDGPVRGAAAAHEGFDPGDEPLDDVIDEKTARQSSEQQAMQLLQDAFGAEKISEL